MEAVSAAIATSGYLEKRIKGEIDRYKKFSKNPVLVDALVDTVTKLKQQLRLLEGKCQQLGSQMSSEWDNGILSSRSATVTAKLKSIEDRLEEESYEKSKAHGKDADSLRRYGRANSTCQMATDCEADGKRMDILRRYGRAKSTCQMLTECEAHARAVERDVVEIYNLAVQAEQVMSIQYCNNTQEEILNRMSPAAEQDIFRASFDVEENPSHVVLHYGSMPRAHGEEDNGETVSPEAQLKRAVLGASEAHDITAAVGSLGMGGVGKSCALRGLAADEDVRRRFPDGVHMIVLGEKASKVDVVKGVSDMVKHSGGRKLAQDMRKEEGDLREVISQARVWFQRRRILLLVDDVWENSEVNRNIMRQLHRSVANGRSRLVFTTRHARLASEYETVRFGQRDKVTSREILLKVVGAGEGSTGSFEDVVDGVLELCAGLPLALAVVGKTIAAGFRYCDEQSWHEVWEETRAAFSNRRNRLVVSIDYDYDKGTLEAVCELSLETLESARRRRLGFEPRMSVHEMYRSLVIQKKQAAVPVGVLRRLWGMDDECDAHVAMNMFVEVSLAERRSVMLNGKTTACLSVHDLQHDFVEAKCRERGEEEQHHRKLLDGWWDRAGPGREVGGQAWRDWSESEAFDDEYMRDNLSRHLVGGGLGSELRGLLRNPRWTAERLRRREVLGLEEDFRLATASVEGDGGTEEGTGSREMEKWGLEMVGGAARLSASFVGRNQGEVWFQLRGRLVGLAEKSSVIREFVDKIDEYAERPWARPTWACLSEPGGSVLSIVQCAGRVEDMRRGEREGEVRVCGVVDGMGFMCSVVNGEMVGKEVFVNKRPGRGCECASVGENEGVAKSGDEGGVPDGCNGGCVDGCTEVEWSAVSSVTYSADESRVMTTHANHMVKMWDEASGEAIGKTFGSRGGKCEWSADGSRVVCGGRDGRVRMWDGVSCEAMGGDERAHGGMVWLVKWSPDGSRVVTGGRDGSVRIWDDVSGEAMGGDERAHGGVVWHVKWSADSRRVVTGGWDGSVKIWDGVSGEAVGGDELAHSTCVSCVEWSADDRRVVTGGRDGSLRMWDGVSGEAVGGDELAHNTRVSYVKWLADGSRFVTSGRDGGVRIWDGVSGEAVGGDERAHGETVSCVEWSADGSWVVTGGEDGSLRIWNGVSGVVVGEDKCAHGGGLSCVEWSADGSRVVSGGMDGNVRIWNCASNEAVDRDKRAHAGMVSHFKWSPNRNRVVCGGFDGSLWMWNGASGVRMSGDERAHGGSVSFLEWSADEGQVVSGGDDGSVRTWDGVSGAAVGGDERAHGGKVRCVKWSADRRLFVTGGWDGSVRIWDGTSGVVMGGGKCAHGGGANRVEWSADGSRVVTGGRDGSVRIWDGVSGEAVGGDELAHSNCVMCVKWSADGSRVVTSGEDGDVRIWDGTSGVVVGGGKCAHGWGVSCVEWSADGSRVVTGGEDGSVRIWDGVSGEAVGGDELAHSKRVFFMKRSADGSRVVTGGIDGSLRIWHLASGEAMGTECLPYETGVGKWSPSDPDVGIVITDGPIGAWYPSRRQVTRVSGEKDAAGRWATSGNRLQHWSVGRRVVLATFEAAHTLAAHNVRCAGQCNKEKGTVVLGFLKNNVMYRVEIVM